MALVLRELYKYYKYYIVETRDNRLDHYFLMGSPFKVITISTAYWYFVKKLGPRLMEKRQPFELKRVMMVYNLIQVVANFIFAALVAHFLIYYEPDLKCMLVDYSNSPVGMYKANMSYCYFLLKLFDFLDTIFFVLRKNYRQVTFLHLYHHCLMMVGTWVGLNYVPAGHLTILGLINCFVHTIMYFYYFLTCVNPKLKYSIGWKKYITQIQILQFVILFIHFGRPLIFGNCKYPKGWLILSVIQNVFMMVLFIDFYMKAYNKDSKKHIK